MGHDEPTWLDEMNSQFMVVNEAGKISVYRQTTDPVLNRAYLETFTFDDLKRAYLNVRVVVGTDNNGEPIYKTKGDAWLRHEQRMQYLA